MRSQRGEEDVTEYLLTVPDVLKRTTLSRSTLYRRVREGAFPRPLDLGGGMIRWRESDVTQWIEGLRQCTES